jgi:hypothetical protein
MLSTVLSKENTMEDKTCLPSITSDSNDTEAAHKRPLNRLVHSKYVPKENGI